MYIFKNAWKSIIRNRGRNILIGIIVLVIAAASTIALAIMNTSTKLIDSYASKYDVIASIGVNRSKMMENFNPNSSSSSSSSKDKLIDNFSAVSNLTVDEIKKYADSDYVSSYYYTYSVGLDGKSIEAASMQKATTTTSDSSSSTKNEIPGGMNKGLAPGGSNTDFNLVGYSSVTAMTEFINGSYTISSGAVSEDDNTCVINKELATLNNISVGDTITLVDPNDSTKVYSLKVTGIFTEKSSDDQMSMFSNSVNNIITTANTVSKIVSNNSSLSSRITPSFVLKSKDVIDDFTSELSTKGLNENLSVTTNLDQVNSATNSVSNVKSFATTFLIIVLIIGAIVLLVINAINIRERKYEIGVMRTIGMKKSTLAFQFMIELAMVSLFALIIGAGVGSIVSKPISNQLLSSEISSSQEQKEDIGKNFGQNFDNKNVKFNGVSNLNAYTSIDATVDIKVLSELLIIGLGLTCISSLASMIAIQKFSPLTILKERS